MLEELRAAVQQRAAILPTVTEVSPRVQEALAILAAGGIEPDRLAEGTRCVGALLEEMHLHRRQRLQATGLTPEQADEMSRLHTANFM